jgi:TctA family transporter
MDMIIGNFNLFYDKSIFFSYFIENIVGAFSQITLLELVFTVFRIPYQMVLCIINCMTRTTNNHASIITASASVDKG